MECKYLDGEICLKDSAPDNNVYCVQGPCAEWFKQFEMQEPENTDITGQIKKEK